MKNFQASDRISISFLFLSVIFGVAAFLPGGLIPSSVLKGYLFGSCVLVAFVAWLIGRLIEGVFRIPKTSIVLALGVFVLAMFLSAFFSHSPYLSFFGEGFEQGTFFVICSLTLAAFLASIFLSSRKRIFFFLKVSLILYVVLAIFQLAHLFFPAATSLGIFSSKTDSAIGLWTDFVFLSGAALIGSLLALHFTRPGKSFRIILWVAAALGLFFAILGNIFLVWILIGSTSIATLVYVLVSTRSLHERRFPVAAFVLSLIALLFLLANSLFGGMLANLLHASFFDIHPSIGSTVHTALLSIRHHIVFGVGPNTFAKEWLVYRPAIVNASSLWNTPFAAGVSLLGTIAFLGGALGILSSLFLIGTVVYEALKNIFTSTENRDSGNTVFATCLITLYFFIAVVFSAPGIAVTVLAFVLVGILIGMLAGEGRISMLEIHFLKDQRSGFFSILGIVLFLLLSVAGAYAATERFASVVFFEKGIKSSGTGDFTSSSQFVSKAIALSDLPVYERTRVLLAEQSIQQILSAPASAGNIDSVRASVQSAVGIGNTAGRQAIKLDPTDPSNYLALADFFRSLTPLKIDGVQASAIDTYQRAIALVPTYPKSYLGLATLYFDAGDNVDARIYVQKALDQKKNYTDAYFLLAQIEVSDGNTAGAIQKIQSAADADPNNPDVYFELGLLRYNSGDYVNAIGAFKTTINLSNQYLNAWYYLALAEGKTGNVKDATDILTALHNRLPENQEVANALQNITAPVVVPPTKPATSKTEKAKKLPLP